ncbi:MAG: S-layer family protein [Muribaculaceae bacterium]|nr:S-layer family protein [Muribaculaceae bacterium]
MNKILIYFYLIVGLVLTVSCSDDIKLPEKPDNFGHSEETCLVEFEAFLPEDLNTRMVDNPKTSFSTDEIIHVEASFFGVREKDDEDGENDEDIILEKCYKTYKKSSSGKWESNDNADFKWPPKAKKGKFRAYFVKGFQQMLLPGDLDKVLRLSDVDGQSDPLYAETEFVSWGHKVNLYFTHLCSHITFTNMEPDISDYFWLVNKKISDDNSGAEIKNKFLLRVVNNEIDDPENPSQKITLQTLEGEFVAEKDEIFNDLSYIQHPSRNLLDDSGRKIGSEVSFFIAPGDYSDIELRTINNYPYLSYQSKLTKDLQPNVSYEIDIKKDKGITIIEKEENWDDDKDAVYDVVPDEFLQSIVKGKEYVITVTEDGETRDKTIIQPTVNGVLLCYNVSFGGSKDYGFYDIPEGWTFDGGNHFISDLATNLFATNFGTIQHLGLKNVNCTDIELTYTHKDEYYNRWGVLCEINKGTVKNVRIDDANISFKIGKGGDNSGYVFNVGSFIGSSTGIVSDLTYGTLNISTNENTVVNSKVIIGGLIGQNLGAISDVTPLSNTSSITITNTLKGDLATFYIGGAVGNSGTNIAGLSLINVNVNSSEAKGLVGRIGGIVGRCRSTTGASLSFCTVQGTVKGITVTPYENFPASSYTGGITGYVSNFTINDCRSICNVEIAKNVPLIGERTYATGGGFGRIITKESVISGNYILGDSLSGPVSSSESEYAYIGNFAGIVPAGISWTEYYEPLGNVVKKWFDVFIGAEIDDNSNEDDDYE